MRPDKEAAEARAFTPADNLAAMEEHHSLYDPDTDQMLYSATWGSPFGFISSVLNFNRAAELLAAVARRLLALPLEHYFDDAFQLDAALHAVGGQEALENLHLRVGIPLEPTKRSKPAAVQTVLGMTVDVSAAHERTPSVKISPTPWRCQQLLEWLGKAEREDCLPSGEASSLMGKLGWILRGVYSSIGRQVCRPFFRRAQCF